MEIRQQTTAALVNLQVELSTRSSAVTIVESTFYIAIAAVAFIGNTTVLWVVYKNPRLRSIPNYFIISLAVSDVLMAGVTAPPSATVLITGKWQFGFITCQLQGVLVHSLACVSTLTLALTALNRYFRIVRPNQYRKIFTKRTAKVAVISAWGLALVDPVVILGAGLKFEFHPGKFFCFQENIVSPATLFLYVYLGIPVLVVSGCYVKVFHVWRQHNKRLQQSNGKQASVSGFSAEDRRVTKTLFITVVGFLLCWTPVLCIDIIDLARGGITMPRQVYTFYTCLGLASSALNPWIYGLMNTTFRNEYKNCLRFGRIHHCLQPVSTRPRVALAWHTGVSPSHSNL